MTRPPVAVLTALILHSWETLAHARRRAQELRESADRFGAQDACTAISSWVSTGFMTSDDGYLVQQWLRA